ncbi:MAG TPA: class II aldolase/adducin family protein [Clostridia bacterium]|nr:class II aldolase/adducin family protein [Clostridia bacterium]
MSDHEHRHELVKLGKMLHEKGFIAATDGNLSVRQSDGTVLSTPTCMCKGMMSGEDMVRVDMDGRKVDGFREVSSEIAMHLTIYKLRPDVNAVVHSHPPTATGYAAAGLSLDQALVSEIVLSLGSVPLAKYATPGTPELSASLAPLVPDHNAILMANHGVVTYAEDLLTAYMHMETVEHFARIALVTHQLGRQKVLSEENVRKLIVAREKYRAMRMATSKPA